MDLIQDIFYRAVRAHGSRVAFDCQDKQVTFEGLWERITHIAGALSRQGIKKGDRIGILSGNCTDYIACHYAAAKIGAILLVLNTRHTIDELLWALNDAEASVLIISNDFQVMLEKLKKGCAAINFTIGIGAAGNAAYSTDELTEARQDITTAPSLSEKDPVLLIYTSGTTGRPKGALQTHEGSAMIDRLTADALNACRDDVYLAFMPYFHQAGLIRTRAVMINGGMNLVPGKMDPESLAACIAGKKVTISMLVPPYDTLLTEIADRDELTFPSLRFIIGAGGAGPDHAKRMKEFCRKFSCRYMGVYGQTEVTGPATIITDEDYFSKPYSCGKAMPGIDLEIWDEERNPAARGIAGEIMIRSKTCVPRYWKNEEASRSLYTGDWLHTGDLARIDDDGFVFFAGRKKELIKTGGENVYPREVEDVLASHPAIAELVVMGLADPDGWGEKVAAVVVLKKNQALTLEEVKAHCRGNIAGYKIPKTLKIIDSIPRNHTGKILKQALADRFRMGYTALVLNLPPDYQEEQIRQTIKKELQTDAFTYQIERKSLDARKKTDIHWTVRVGVLSSCLDGPAPEPVPALSIPHKSKRGEVVVVGSGPAGFFSAFVLQKAGYHVSIIERGTDVEKRSTRIRQFEKTGVFDPLGNYAFGEGGAGTFSDGKLTARTKGISPEKSFVISRYIEAGAPGEIAYLAHPHLGSDNLKSIIKTLTRQFRDMGGRILFETLLDDLKIRNGSVVEALTSQGGLEADHFIIAPGHSAYDTYRMLMRRGVMFTSKNFAIGSRMEHPQALINDAQWGQARLPGVKAAEYRLTSKGGGGFPVYSFCMCPGGVVVPAAATRHTNIVNGMSLYARAGEYANAGCVAGIDLNTMLGKDVSAPEALDWLETLENKFFAFSEGFRAPSCGIKEFMDQKSGNGDYPSSYTLGLKPAPLWELLPARVSQSIRYGLKEFARKIKGFETGILMGLESKTSSPIQVIREKDGRCVGFDNLFIVGEGSGFAGGIISSAVDGIRCALKRL